MVHRRMLLPRKPRSKTLASFQSVRLEPVTRRGYYDVEPQTTVRSFSFRVDIWGESRTVIPPVDTPERVLQPTRKEASPDFQSDNLAYRNAEFMKALESFQILPTAPTLHVDLALAQFSRPSEPHSF
jgi:hypothetical protein